MRVLIVDDEPLVRKSLRRAFEASGHSVAEAHDGTHALKVWPDFSPELVLLDVLMPGLSGPDVLKNITYDKNQCKVILMSAFAGDYQLVADGFIAKPFEDIFEIVQFSEKIKS